MINVLYTCAFVNPQSYKTARRTFKCILGNDCAAKIDRARSIIIYGTAKFPNTERTCICVSVKELGGYVRWSLMPHWKWLIDVGAHSSLSHRARPGREKLLITYLLGFVEKSLNQHKLTRWRRTLSSSNNRAGIIAWCAVRAKDKRVNGRDAIGKWCILLDGKRFSRTFARRARYYCNNRYCRIRIGIHFNRDPRLSAEYKSYGT